MRMINGIFRSTQGLLALGGAPPHMCTEHVSLQTMEAPVNPRLSWQRCCAPIVSQGLYYTRGTCAVHVPCDVAGGPRRSTCLVPACMLRPRISMQPGAQRCPLSPASASHCDRPCKVVYAAWSKRLASLRDFHLPACMIACLHMPVCPRALHAQGLWAQLLILYLRSARQLVRPSIRQDCAQVRAFVQSLH